MKKKGLIIVLSMIILFGFSCININAHTSKQAISAISSLKSNLKREDIRVKVDWMDQEQGSVNVTLFANKKAYKKKTITKKDKWQYTFKKVPVKKNGKAIKYTILEDRIQGYTTEIIGTAKKGFIISNIESDKLDEKTTIKINMEWIGPSMKQVKVKLKANNKVVKTISLNQKDNYIAYIKDMPTFDSKKHKIVYSITTNSPSSYTSFIAVGIRNNFTITCVYKSEKNIQPTNHEEQSTVDYYWPLVLSASMIFIVLIVTIATQVHKDHKEQ